MSKVKVVTTERDMKRMTALLDYVDEHAGDDVLAKHLPGQHDQATHASYAQGTERKFKMYKRNLKVQTKLMKAAGGDRNKAVAIVRGLAKFQTEPGSTVPKEVGEQLIKAGMELTKKGSASDPWYSVDDTPGNRQVYDVFSHARSQFVGSASWKDTAAFAPKIESWAKGETENRGLDLMYAATQLQLDEMNSERGVIVHRGTFFKNMDTYDAIKDGTVEKTDVDTFGHWSLSPEVSSTTMFSGEGDGSVVFVMNVNKKDILWHYKVHDFGYTSEQEVWPIMMQEPRVRKVTEYRQDPKSWNSKNTEGDHLWVDLAFGQSSPMTGYKKPAGKGNDGGDDDE